MIQVTSNEYCLEPIKTVKAKHVQLPRQKSHEGDDEPEDVEEANLKSLGAFDSLLRSSSGNFFEERLFEMSLRKDYLKYYSEFSDYRSTLTFGEAKANLNASSATFKKDLIKFKGIFR